MPLKTYLVNKVQGKKFRLNGIVRSRHLPHNQRLCQTFSQHRIYGAEQLPPKVDLRPEMTAVEDQSSIGSCAANTLAGAYEYLTKKSTGRDVDVSRLFIYYNARVKGNKSQTVEDSGCTMTDAIEALEEFGTCLESVWPYDISRVNTRPSDQAYKEAVSYKINEALRVNINLTEMKSCLAQGFPFAFGLQLYTSFDKAAKTGVVPMPNTSESSRESDGSHALLAVGYSDQSRAFIVRNSWGADWGDKGYCYIPYEYMTNSELCFDAWAVRKIANDDFGQQNWHFQDAEDYLHPYQNRFTNDNDDDDDNHVIENLNEDDDYYSNNQNSWFNTNDYRSRFNYNDQNSWYNKNNYNSGHNNYGQNAWYNDNDYNPSYNSNTDHNSQFNNNNQNPWYEDNDQNFSFYNNNNYNQNAWYNNNNFNNDSDSYRNYERNDYSYGFNQNTTYDGNNYNSNQNYSYYPYNYQRDNFDRYSDYN